MHQPSHGIRTPSISHVSGDYASIDRQIQTHLEAALRAIHARGDAIISAIEAGLRDIYARPVAATSAVDDGPATQACSPPILGPRSREVSSNTPIEPTNRDEIDDLITL